MKILLPLIHLKIREVKFSFSSLKLNIFSLILLITVAFGIPAFAQGVAELDEAILAMQASGDPDIVQQGNHLQSLVYDLHPTLYLRNGDLSNPLGGAPMCLNTDVASFWKLYETNNQYSQVELLIVLIEDPSALSSTLNVASLQSFSNLSGVLFMSKFQVCSPPNPACETQAIGQMIAGGQGSGLQYYYKISISN